MEVNTPDQKRAEGWLYQASGEYSSARSVLDSVDALLHDSFHNDEPTRYNYGYGMARQYKVTIIVEEM
jgi:hypothetical protein